LRVYNREFTGLKFGDHSLHSFCGFAFSYLPLSFAYTQHLMSAVFSAGAVALVAAIIFRLTGSFFPAIAGAVALTVSQSFWLYAVITETYSLLNFLLALMLYIALAAESGENKNYYYLLVFLCGLTFSLHGLLLLFIPCFLIIIYSGKFRSLVFSRNLVLLILAFIIGGSQVFIFNKPNIFSPNDFIRQFNKTTFIHYHYFGGELNKILKETTKYPAYLFYQFPVLGFFIGIYGIIALSRINKRICIATGLTFIFVVLFASYYFFQRQFAMLISSYLIFSIWIGFGVSRLIKTKLLNRLYKRYIFIVLLTALPPVIYYTAYKTLDSAGFKLKSIRELPYRNTLKYYLFPPKNDEYGAEKYTKDAFAQAPKNAVILADFNPGMALLFGQQILNWRPDLELRIDIDEIVHYSNTPDSDILNILDSVTAAGKIILLADTYPLYYKTDTIKTKYALTQSGGPLWLASPISRH